MITLTRKVSEGIAIGDHITISVLGISSKQATFAIEAPSDIKVTRAEMMVTEHRLADSDSNDHSSTRVGR